jgi:hypothetical protein
MGGLRMGCVATRPSVLVLPRSDVSFESFKADDVYCRQYAEADSKEAYNEEGWNSFGRTLLGASFGAALGASIGSGFGMAGYGANVGAVYGAGATTGYGYHRQRAVSQRAFDITSMQCMRTKGHKLPGFQSIDDQPSAPTVASVVPQCADATIRAQCPLYEYRTGVYREKCQDGSGLEVGTGYVNVIPPPVDRPHPWQAEGASGQPVSLEEDPMIMATVTARCTPWGRGHRGRKAEREAGRRAVARHWEVTQVIQALRSECWALPCERC